MLETDKELAKKIGLSDIHELTTAEKKEYLDAQITGVKSQLWRARVDAILNHHLSTDGEQERMAVEAKIREHEGNARRYVEAISLMTDLESEL